MIGRRSLLAAGLLLAAPVRVLAQQPARLGFLGGGMPEDSALFLANLRTGLARLGPSRASGASIEARYAERDLGRIPALIAEIERSGADVIVTHAQATVPVVMAERRLPAVYQFSADPVASRIAAALSQPGYNATGITLFAAELIGKRLELAREIVPRARRLAVIFNPLHPGEDIERAWIERSAGGLGFAVSYHPASDRATLDAAMAAMMRDPADITLALADGFVLNSRAAILAAVGRERPVIGGWAPFAQSGALFTYGPRLASAFQRPAYFVDRILRGAQAAELPIERPTELELVVNLDVARRLGIDLPPSFLARADEVIG